MASQGWARATISRRAVLIRGSATVALGAFALSACGGGTAQNAGVAATTAMAAPPTAAAAATTTSATATASVASSAPATSAVSSPQGNVTTVVYGQTWDPGEGPYIKAWMDKFNQTNAGKVQVAQGDQGDSNKLTALAASNTMPDIVAVGSTTIQSWIPRGWIKNVQAFVNQDKAFDIADFTPPSLFAYRSKGDLYGLPFDEGPYMLWYNLDIFDAAGMKHPDDTWTFDDLLSAAIKLTKGDGDSKIYGFASLLPSPFKPNQYSAVAPFGGAWVNEAEDQTLIDSPDTIQGTQWWLDLLLKNKAVPTADEASKIQNGAFFAQRAAMTIDGTWKASQAAEIGKFRYDVAPYPKGPKAHVTGANGSGLAISKDTKAPDASWLFLSSFLSKDSQVELFGANGRGSPARASAWAAFEKSPSAMPSAKLILPILMGLAKHEQPIGPKAGDMQQAVATPWNDVLKGTRTLGDFAQQAKGLVAPLLSANKLQL